jgi:hypothetical protein
MAILDLPKRFDNELWARYVLADLKSVEFSNTTVKVKSTRLSQWAPTAGGDAS